MTNISSSRQAFSDSERPRLRIVDVGARRAVDFPSSVTRRKTIWSGVLIRQIKTEIAVYDALLVPGAVLAVSQPLIVQLNEGGRLTIAARLSTYQESLRVVKREKRTPQRFFSARRFVPLLGRHGWQRETGKAGRG